MYPAQAKAVAETKERRGQVDCGMYAFALGIPDGPKWEDGIYSHFKEQRRVPHGTIANTFITKGAPDSHVKALHTWNGGGQGERATRGTPSMEQRGGTCGPKFGVL